MYRFMQRDQIGTSDPDPEPRQQYEVHCGRCNWWGKIEHLRVIYKPSLSEPGCVTPEQGCPICLSDQWLEYENHSIGRLELEPTLFALRLAKIRFEGAMKDLRETVNCQTSQ